MDPEFEKEQRHLSETHVKLLAIERNAKRRLEATLEEASDCKSEMGEDATLDVASDDTALETYADLEAKNRIIDNYSRSSKMGNDKLRQARFLLERPYFAKVSLRFKPDEKPRDIYLGAAGMTDENSRHFIVDWRSPVAETYYNQGNGFTSYVANGRRIDCELTLRRQFDLHRDTLEAYFDTTVAIEDPLLLESLSRSRSNKLGDITATIQKEQNLVVRHEDVRAMLVQGVAGSGKTSVMMQRIAYLFYTYRDSLRPDRVCLLSPNRVFCDYIDKVLPDMGESNPRCTTWSQIEQDFGLTGRIGADPSGSSLAAIEQRTAGLPFAQGDFRDLKVGGERVIGAGQVAKAVAKLKGVPAGSRLAGLVAEDLLEKLEHRIARMAKREEVHDALLDLDIHDQLRLFGCAIQPEGDEDFERLARIYLEDRYRPIAEAIERADWIAVDRIGRRILGKDNLSAEEWLYLKICLTGWGDRETRYVMIDEVQDYTLPQLMVISRYYRNANFLLLGDPNQAIAADTADFATIRRLFEKRFGEVCVCKLSTSYRCSARIAALFEKLMDPDPDMKLSCVQGPGCDPEIASFEDGEAYLAHLRELIARNEAEGGLCAVVAHDSRAARRLAADLGEDAPVLIGKRDRLPERGSCIIPLALAKGLEFDRVIIPDAQACFYGADSLSRHRLYTAISRGTKRVDLLAKGPLSPLLA